MGIYLNPGTDGFVKTINSEIYIDKTGLLNYTNRVINTLQGYICVSRPRRFGKSITASMLAAYYSCDCDSKKLFSPFEIAKSSVFETYLNQYDTIFLNMQEFMSQSHNMDDMLKLIRKSVLWELLEKYPDYRYFDNTNLTRTMQDVYNKSKRPFVVIIDEWDCIFRELKIGKDSQEKYLDFLRDLLKDKPYIHLAYMTGILPIKKYGTHSALNMFDEFSMLNPGPLAPYVGFTEDEVAALCQKYQMDLDEIKNWYDGYSFSGAPSVYSPRSVVNSMLLEKIGNYWNQTETFEALQVYIDMNFDSLKDDILSMIAGESVPVNTGSFINDMTTFRTEDDVLTLLIHLGYLSYDSVNKCVFIPNEEVRTEYINAVDENALSYTISLALFAARNFYTIYRELPTGKGFADLVFLPRKRFPEKPALLVELKWDKSATGAITQIKEKEYVQSLEEYHGNLLLVGINYDVKTKEHECVIEPYVI